MKYKKENPEHKKSHIISKDKINGLRSLGHTLNEQIDQAAINYLKDF